MKRNTLRNYIQELLIDVLKSDFPLHANLDFSLAEPPNRDFGDYATNLPLLLAKRTGNKPKEVAKTLIPRLQGLDRDREAAFLEASERAGFINFRFYPEYLLKILAQINADGGGFGASQAGGGKKILVEYFQNNVAKPPHVGHVRSAVIGDSILRILRYLGYAAESDTHIGDWGTQFGILLSAYKEFINSGGERTQIASSPIEELNKLYVVTTQKIEDQPELLEKGKQEFAKLEKGDTENRSLWEWFVAVSAEDFEKYRVLLDILPFDHALGESFYLDKMPEVLADTKKLGLLTESEGAQIVNLEDKKLGVAIMVKSDGATTYLLRDLATIKHRISRQKFSKILYVVDSRQAHHFQQVFEIASRLGYVKGSGMLLHVDFGFMSLPEGAISTRKGSVVSLKNLIEETQKRTLQIIEEKNPSLPKKNMVARQVALAAIKYFDLSHNRKSDIVFRWDEVLDFEGNSGPYLQYAYVRISGILRKLGQPPPAQFAGRVKKIAFDQTEMRLLRKLAKFPDAVEDAAADYMPHIICTYLYELSQDFNSFYEAVWVLKEKDKELKNFRIALIAACGTAIQRGLGLLGIEAIQEM